MARRLLALSLLILAAGSPARADAAPSPAITPSQIEADWLTQAKLRSPIQTEQAAAAADAAGGCDGVVNGKWGFHTANEKNPWWQIDLGRSTRVDRIVLYNRCDGNFESRNSRVIILFGDAPEKLAQVYQHNGQPFYGHGKGEPLTVPFEGRKTRFVRLQVPIHTYFHLDEVQIFDADTGNNVALGKPATQSSISQWSPARTIHRRLSSIGRQSSQEPSNAVDNSSEP